MQIRQILMTELGRIVRFGLTGTVATLAYAVVGIAIVEAGISNPVVAATISYCVAATISYTGHLYFSFRVEPDHRKFLWRFAVTVLVTFPMTIGCTWLITEYWSYSYRVSVLAVTVLIPATNYIFNRFWVFMPNEKA